MNASPNLPSGNLNIDLSVAVADIPSEFDLNFVIMSGLTGHPRSSIKGMLVFFLLNAKQFFTLIPFVSDGKRKNVRLAPATHGI
jgi:hypothetical protein